MAADEGEKSTLARTLTIAFAMARLSVSGILLFLGIGAVAGIVMVVIGYLFGSQIVAGLAALVLAAGAIVLRWTGVIFNFFIDHLIVKYSATLQTLGIMDGVNVVWTAFRDIANIALIALFVFLAINIILGVKEFGEKRTIAKVLIIAVLLNFSLLFTKVIIDAANFTAYQFYKSAGLERSASAGSSSTGIQVGKGQSASTPGGMADAFLSAAGITSIGDTYSGIKALADKSTPAALAFSVVAAILLFVMVALFLYGSFQMITRAILLVFLMIISPLAFVSWLIPHGSIETKWKRWWENLVSAAFFAPIFMIMLWASSLLLRNASAARGNMTLGEFFTSPKTNTDAWMLIVVYCFAVGLLYASIKFASIFAGSISGYGLVSQGLRNALVGIPALGWRFGVAPLARQTIGRSAYFRREELLKRGRELGAEAGDIRQKASDMFKLGRIDEAERDRRYKDAARREKEAGKYALMAGQAERIAKTGFNLGDAGLVKQLAKATGTSELLAGQRPKEVDIGFAQQIATKVKRTEDQMKALEVKPGEQQRIMEEEAKRVHEKYSARAGELDRAHETAKAERDAKAREVEPDVTVARRKLADATREAEREKVALARSWQTRLAALQQESEAAAPGPARDAVHARIAAETTTFNEDIKRHEAVVKGWERTVEEVKAPLTAASKRLEDTADDLAKFTKNINDEARGAGQERIRARQLGNVGTAEHLGRRSAGVVERTVGTKVVEEVAGGAAKSARAKVGRGNLRAALARYRREFPDEFTDVAGET
ncbi:hypothetical protein HY414_02135 [Candidatus Kaiserbacteria bacterium]|nr:hypothetical protein [Candidatus Kaiserbacteria bacterium]